jgi:hypothetical protein
MQLRHAPNRRSVAPARELSRGENADSAEILCPGAVAAEDTRYTTPESLFPALLNHADTQLLQLVWIDR